MWFESDEFSKMKKKQSAFGELVRYPFTVFITGPYGDPIFHRIEVKVISRCSLLQGSNKFVVKLEG